jgi:hypothetical protein
MKMKHTLFIKTAVLIAGLCLGTSAQAGENATNPEASPMTFSDLLKQGITLFIDKDFALKTKVMWEYTTAKIPEDPTPDSELRKKAGQLMLPLEGQDFTEGRSKKGIQASGVALTRKTGTGGREVYAFGDTLMTNNDKEYVMTVRLKLRPGFTKANLDNPAFVKQSNNPRYWSQTFEIEILTLREAP